MGCGVDDDTASIGDGATCNWALVGQGRKSTPRQPRSLRSTPQQRQTSRRARGGTRPCRGRERRVGGRLEVGTGCGGGNCGGGGR